MDELIAFVRARLDEDEAMAAAACVTAQPPWKSADHESDYRIVTDAEGNAVVYYEGTPTLEEAAHIARHDPARALREVEAKRRILDDYRITAGACQRVTGAEIDTPGYRAMCAGRDALRSCVTLLAAVWSDHPGYAALAPLPARR